MKIFYYICVCALSLLLVSCLSISQSAAELGLPSKTVVITFDDGPNPDGETTGRLLDVLLKYDVKAAFALLGVNAEACPELVLRIEKEGNTIINHGYSDKWAVLMNEKEFRENLERCAAVLESILGHPLEPKLYRPQGGFYTQRQKALCLELGWTIVGANVRVYDAVLTGKDESSVISKVVEGTEKQGSAVILLHDGFDSIFKKTKLRKTGINSPYNREWMPDAVEKIIISLKNKGYVLSGIDIVLLLAGMW